MDTILTVPEAAKHVKLSKSKVYWLVETRKIPHIKIGKNVRIREKNLEEWIEENLVETVVKP